MLAMSTANLKRSTKNPNDKPVNVQDVFLNHVRKSKAPVTVFLVNGVKLLGVVTWFDSFSLLLRKDGHSQLVYKHAISTVMPQGPIKLFDNSENNDNNNSESDIHPISDHEDDGEEDEDDDEDAEEDQISF
jgi:host factor-I protein